MIHVLAVIELRPGRRADFLAEFRKIVPAVHAEAGCLAYGPAVDLPTPYPAQPPERPDVVTIVEQWESLAHLDAHLNAPHMIEYRPKVKPMIMKATLHVLQPA